MRQATMDNGMQPLLDTVDEELRNDADNDSGVYAGKQRMHAVDVVYSYAFLTIVFIGRICQGFFVIIISPTILYLAENVNRSVASMAAFFAARSLGFMLGGLIAGFFMKVRNPLTSTGVLMIFCSVCVGLIPATTSLILLSVIGIVSGTIYGYFEAVLQGSILNVFGEKNSRSHIQVFHFAFGVGAFLAPLVAKPFLEAASLVQEEDAKCPHRNNTDDIVMALDERNSTTVRYSPIALNGINPISYVFFISATFTGVVGISLLVAAHLDMMMGIKRHRMSQGIETETRPEESFKDVISLLVLFTLSFFFLLNSEVSVSMFIYAIAVCSKLNLSTSNATMFTFVSTGGYSTGRCLGVLASLYFKPHFLALVMAFSAFLASLLFSVLGEKLPAISWAAVFFYGFFVGPLYSSFVSWISQLCNVSGKYIFVLTFGTGTGAMVSAPIAGFLFDQNPIYVVYYSTVTIALMILTFLLLIFYDSRRHKKSFHDESPPNLTLETTSFINDVDSS